MALEGGGSKSAPFTLGVLAGLHEAGLFKQGRIGAISSVSGGSYAASFLFNRLWDYHSHQPSVTEVPEACREAPPPTDKASLRADAGKPGTYDDWFRSCVPDPYTAGGAPLDGPRGGLPQCGEVRGRGHKSFNEFHDEYRYQGHVWRFPDLLFGDGMAMLKTDRVARFPEAAQTAGLTVASAGTFPLQLVSRTLFRWPINTAPTKNVYRYGIERQFGFSPEDWQEAQKLAAKMTEVSAQRRRERTLACLGTLLNGKAAPTWILNSSTPGPITVLDWVTTPERNPLLNSFELTAAGYGSGLYGYAKMPPRFRFEFEGYRYTPRDMSMTDGVVASAAFFDDNQSLFSDQPTRFIMGAVQYLLNLTWFTEIPNYNADRDDRVRRNIKPYPLWGIPVTYAKRNSPYIHLQDGGNSENSGIFALLRRGYRTIVFAHGTDDRQAMFPSLCHLKNTLELYGAYRVDSRDFHVIATKLAESNVNPFKRSHDDMTHVFRDYLDQLCSYELDESTRAHFGSELADEVSPLSRLYCTRLQYDDAATNVCRRYRQRFPTNRSDPTFEVPKNWDDPERMFFRWSGTRLDFQVRRTRDCPMTKTIVQCGDPEVLATIVVITPAIDWNDLRPQLSGPPEIEAAGDWAAMCAMAEPRNAIRIRACAAPLQDGMGQDSRTSAEIKVPCTAAAYVVTNACRPDGRDYAIANGTRDHKQRLLVRVVPETYVPEFPQDNFIWTTWNSSYVMFAAYFDLGRHYARRAAAEFSPPQLPPSTDGSPP